MPGVPSEAPQSSQCVGPAELCAQVVELKSKLANQQQQTSQIAVSHDKQASDRAAKAMAAAAMMAVIIKLIISALRAWGGYLKGDRGQAIIKIALGFLGVFVLGLTNYGFGMVWWQALIIAGGAPGAIVVHEIVALWPVIIGKEKLKEVKDLPPDQDLL